MKYSLLIITILFYSCSVHSTKLENRKPYNAKGFAYIFNQQDYKDKVIKGKLENSQLEIAHRKLKPNTFIKITNLKNKESLTLKNKKKIKYPDFYKILITKEVAKKLNLDQDVPLVEVLEIKKNKSFIAKKAKIFNEEKKISSNAPVTSVKISNISRNKNLNVKIEEDKFYILIASFYSKEVAEFLKQRITKEISSYNNKKLKLAKKNNNKINLISGPYKTINLMKNDYILLKKFGFEELDIITNE